MASTQTEKFSLASISGTTRRLCPWLTLLIENLLKRITENSDVDDVESAEVEGRGPTVSDPLIGV